MHACEITARYLLVAKLAQRHPGHKQTRASLARSEPADLRLGHGSHETLETLLLFMQCDMVQESTVIVEMGSLPKLLLKTHRKSDKRSYWSLFIDTINTE